MKRNPIDQIPNWLQKLLLDTIWVRFASLGFGLLFCAGIQLYLQSDGRLKWLILDKENIPLAFRFWNSWVTGGLFALVVLLILGGSFATDRAIRNASAWIYSKTSFVGGLSRCTRELVVTGGIALLLFAYLVPIQCGHYHSIRPLQCLVIALLVPYLVLFALAILAGWGRSHAHSQVRLSTLPWTTCPYEVLVVDGCDNQSSEELRREYLDYDNGHGQRNIETFQKLKSFLKCIFSDLSAYFGKREGTDQPLVAQGRFVIAETAWEAFAKVLGQANPRPDFLIATSLEPVELISRLRKSGTAFASEIEIVPVEYSSDSELTGKVVDGISSALAACASRLTGNAANSGRSASILLSHVDCSTGSRLNLKAVTEGLTAKLPDWALTFVSNAHHSIGNVVLSPDDLASVSFMVTDFGHWFRGAQDLGLIVVGERPALTRGTATLLSDDEAAKIAESLASMQFGISKHLLLEQPPAGFAPLPRIKACDLVSVAPIINDLAGVVPRSVEFVATNPDKFTTPQQVVSKHNTQLAKDFIEKFKARVSQSPGSFRFLEVMPSSPEGGIVVLVHNKSVKAPDALRGQNPISWLRAELAQDGFQGKLLGPNHGDEVYAADRLRFCFQYFHNSWDVDRLIGELERVLGRLSASN